MRNIDHIVVLSLLGAYTAKLLILGAKPADALVVLILAVAHGFHLSQIQNKKVLQLNRIVEKQNVDIEEIKKVIDDVKTSMASVKITQGLTRRAQ